MKRGTITLVLSKNATDEEIKAIRAIYGCIGYNVNIIISGNEPFINNLKEFLQNIKL